MRYALVIVDVVAIVVAIDLRIFLPSANWIERYYSNGYYPRIDEAIRAVSQPLPFSLGDALLIVLLVTVLTWWLDNVRLAIRKRSMGRIGLALLRIAGLGAALYIWFMVAWAYNYDRVPVSAKIILHNERTTEDSVAAFADRVVDELNSNAQGAHDEGMLATSELSARLTPTFESTIHRLGSVKAYSAPPVKPTVFQLVMQASGSDGFMDPWTHELNLDQTLSAYERPAIYAHEWGHLAGFADESEANFIAVLACTNSADPLLRYSGWLLTWFNLPSNVHVTHGFSPTVAADVEAIRRRYQREVNPAVEHAQRTAYNAYLHANHVKAGYASYEYFVRWLTGADFDQNGLPAVKSRTNAA